MDHSTRWNTYLSALNDYVAANGHALVPAGYKHTTETGETVNLGAWVGYIRQRYRSGALPQSRIDTLQQYPGWAWGPLRPGPRTNEERNSEILELRLQQGLSLQKIADRYGLTRQRVHQIVRTKAPISE